MNLDRRSSPTNSPSSEFLWGADEIGAAIGRNGRQAFHLLSSGDIKSARKVRGRLRVAPRSCASSVLAVESWRLRFGAARRRLPMSKLARCRIRNLWDLFGPCVARLHWFAIRDAKISEGKFAGRLSPQAVHK